VKALLLAAALLVAAPTLAQTAPVAVSTSPEMDAPRGDRPMRGAGGRRGQMFASMTPEGRQILRDAMRGAPADRDAVKASRDRITALVAAERLDVSALKRAMDDERRLVDTQHARRQSAMIAAFQKLTPADRKAFADDALRGRQMIEARAARSRDRDTMAGAE
jgi:Spy/CpxP family protein refolding chaperone